MTTPAIPLHPDLQRLLEQVYQPNRQHYSTPEPEAESAEYGAHVFQLEGQEVRFRVAKTTPTKLGQFVTLWKRVGRGAIQPHDITDPVEWFVISVHQEEQRGYFVFPKTVLHQQGVIATHGIGGKRAIRVYPPWAHNLNPQARRSQQWQLPYFLATAPR